MMNLRTEKKIILTIVSLTMISFFFGFIIDENSGGGGDYFGDIILIWENQKIFFKNTLVEAIAHEDYLDRRSPLAYIIHG